MVMTLDGWKFSSLVGEKKNKRNNYITEHMKPLSRQFLDTIDIHLNVEQVDNGCFCSAVTPPSPVAWSHIALLTRQPGHAAFFAARKRRNGGS